MYKLAVALVAAIALSSAPPAPDVAVTVSVLDSRDTPLQPAASDFRVFEDGVEQTVTSVTAASELPTAFTFLIDSSGSATDAKPAPQVVARECVKVLRPQDSAAVASFANRLKLRQDFTNDKVALDKAIASIRPDGATALLNAIGLTLRTLHKNVGVQAGRVRSVIVVFSDGDDTSSLTPASEVLKTAMEVDTIIYAVSWKPGSDTIRGMGGVPRSDLPPFVNATGGRAFVAARPVEITKVCAGLMADVAGQHIVRYTSSNVKRDGTWRRIEVKVAIPGAKARTRSGYFAPRT